MTTYRQETRVSAYGLLLQENKILLCRLAGRSFGNQGKWTLPGGGIEFAEEPEAAMVREVQEETGLAVKAAGLAGIDSFLVERDDLQHHGIRIVYHTTEISGTLRFEQNGTTDRCEWFSYEDTRKLPLVSLAEYGIHIAFPRESFAPQGKS